ncbi:hypothetical protein M2138_001815 [Dysgonomonadaceae bacterium PH5-43]|nr:hypothetical protein [Dysgonomonadaceae bacterium PH5-43]
MNKLLSIFLVFAFSFSANLFSQDYEEYEFTDVSYDSLWSNVKNDLNYGWVSSDIRFEKNVPPTVKPAKVWKTTAWKGEAVNLQAVIWTKKDLGEIKANVNNVSISKNIKIPDENLQISAVRFVVTDELNKNKNGTCGHRPDPTKFDSLLVADVIDIKPSVNINANEVRPFWVKIKIPQDAKAGTYKGVLSFNNSELSNLPFEIKVQDKILPEPKDWAFHLDLWQNPFSVARYHNVPLWSEEHLELMRPVMKILADAGQKIITTSIMHKPWNAQTYDYFESMVMRIKKLDGSWQYDYSVLDKWVEYMMSVGIDQQINCYTLIPWDLSFQYFDQASDQLKKTKANPGTKEFDDYWLPFLIDFASHLKAKGWFDITTIAMDERPMKSMQQVIKLIKKADPNYKVSLAGNYHAELVDDLYDYCIALRQNFPPDVLEKRKNEGKKSTIYTCCSEAYPNSFTFSPPAESAWYGWYAANKGYDGYLRWAYSSWVKDPLVDTRFTAFGAGDCFFVYPNGRSSIRMEKLIEGIQAYEKVRILREKFTKENNKAKLDKLNKILSAFEEKNLKEVSASDAINKANAELNKL